ncbi:M56 family metallopeptidase [Ancylomarina longa]|nr:M56 family metallopeptidase [Ancylomarina longa]
MAFFYALYWLFLKRDTFFRINRIFLLLTLVASIIIPSLEIPFQTKIKTTPDEYNMLDAVVITSHQYLNTNMLQEVVVTATAKNNLIWYQYLGLIYGLGVFVFAVRFLKNIIQLLVWGKSSKRIHEKGVKLVIMKDHYPPFSFLNAIFISREDFNKPNFESILAHERVHVEQFHTFDLLLIEILSVLFWLNPIIWFYKLSIQEVHEYLADDQVVSDTENPNTYKMHIVNQIVGGELFRLANNFGQSTVKKRISMLGKIKTPKIALVKLLLLIPIFIILFSAFSFTIREEKKISSEDKISQWIPDDLKHFYSFSTDIYGIDNEEELHFDTKKVSAGIKSLEYKDKINQEEIFTISDEMSEYPGGVVALQNFIAKNIIYPKKAEDENIEGRVFVSFVVNKLGKVTNEHIVKGDHTCLNKEALRVISTVPNWKHGKRKGNPVNVAYTISVNFNLKNLLDSPVVAPQPLFKRIKNASDYLLEDKLKLQTQKSFYIIEQMPKFTGGIKGFRRYVASHIKYPILAVEQGYQGQIFVNFLVNNDGRVTHAKIIKGANVELNREALRVINNMPKWIPGKQNDKNVAVSYIIPIRFSLH